MLSVYIFFLSLPLFLSIFHSLFLRYFYPYYFFNFSFIYSSSILILRVILIAPSFPSSSFPSSTCSLLSSSLLLLFSSFLHLLVPCSVLVPFLSRFFLFFLFSSTHPCFLPCFLYFLLSPFHLLILHIDFTYYPFFSLSLLSPSLSFLPFPPPELKSFSAVFLALLFHGSFFLVFIV